MSRKGIVWRVACVSACLLQAIQLAVAHPAVAADRADEDKEPSERETRPSLHAGPLSNDFALDGLMGEPDWASADSIGNLTTIEPKEGGVPAGRTVVKVLADPRGILIGIRCFDPDAKRIVAFSKARDSDLSAEDHILLVLDPFLDGRSGYVFQVNPAGARVDGLVAQRGEEVNTDWDATWQAATARDAAGWGVEIWIPIASIAFRKAEGNWGFNVQRRVQRLQETSRWSGAHLDYEIYQTSHAGLLTGLPAFDLGAGLSVRPAAVQKTTKPGPHESLTSDEQLSLDATKRLGPQLLSALTVNTDFSETEVDVERINLTRFPISFPEKRTFFLQGSDIFEFGLGLDEETLIPFYSRRIGLVGSEEDDHVPVPIDVGGKINGRMGGTDLGALLVNTRKTDNLALSPAGPWLNVPDATMGALRIRQDVLEESAVGLLATFGDQMARRGSWSGGMDFTYQTSSFLEDKNLLAGIWGLHNDRDSLTGDKNAWGARIDFPNDLIDATAAVTRIGDGFDPSLGFVPRNGVQIFSPDLQISPRPGWPLVRQIVGEASYVQYKNLRSDRWESYTATLKPLSVIFESGDLIDASLSWEGDRPTTPFEVYPEIDILPGSYAWARKRVEAQSAKKRRISGSLGFETGGYYTGDLNTVTGSLALKPSALFTLELTGERNHGRVMAPLDYPVAPQLVEMQFIQDLIGCRFELNFTPDLQISSLTQYDSESRELGSNTRLRWTFHPNGDLFVVYNHQEIRTRSDTGPLHDLDKHWQYVSSQLPIKIQFAWRL